MYKICSYLLPEPVAFAKILVPDADNPGMFYFYSPMEMATEKSNPDFYKGRMVILFNEKTKSHAEFTCMAFQTAPDCISIGSQTAGADGNTIRVSIVGGISASFSAVGVFYPDGRPPQWIGILPDIMVNPTIKGIREGHDEVLEKALEIIQ